MSDDDAHPMDEIEVLNIMRNAAKMARALYLQLVDEGFAEAEAHRMTRSYLHGLAGGKSE
jgi:hypothetical protein